jgi:DNA-binding Xre family transcriptional regulator
VPLAYRLAKRDAIQRIDARTLEKLCDVFGVGPGELLELETKRRRSG